MIEEHRELRAAIAGAESKARALYGKGATGLESAVRSLKAIGADLDQRIRAYEVRAGQAGTATPPPPAKRDQTRRTQTGQTESDK